MPTIISKINIPKVFETLKLDKKVRYGKVNFVLARGIGEVFVSDKVPLSTVRGALKEMMK